MAGASYPKTDAERRHRNPPAFTWTELPAAGRDGPAPDLPDGREWPTATRTAWVALWKKPQATAWDQTGETLHRWAWLHADLTLGKGGAASLSGEMRQIEDRHGLSPKAMLQLRWRVVDEPGQQNAPKPKPTGRRPRLKVVDNHPA